MEKTIKSITPVSCPGCKSDFYIEFEMRPTTLTDIYTKDQVTEAKTSVLKQIKVTKCDPEKAESVINWVTDPETVFGPNEVPLIIKSLTENKEK